MSFKRLDPEDFTFGIDSVAAPAWSNYTASLTSFYTSSIQPNSPSGLYYLDIYDDNPIINDNAEIQFSIAYGDIKGSGSFAYSPVSLDKSPTRTVFGQFVNTLLGEDEGASFGFGGSNTNNECFYAIVINRARYKQAIMPGSIQFKFTSGPWFITDNSKTTSIVEYTNAGRRYTLGSGSFGDGVMPAGGSAFGVYGYVYPDVGIILLNPPAVVPGTIVRNSNTDNNNPERLRRRLEEFTLQSQETITSNYIFCRVQNHEFNFSTQPNFISSTRNITGSSGAINNDFIKTPPTYITSVGLYNDNNELLAVAKLSKPLKKDFTTEALIRVKLDF